PVLALSSLASLLLPLTSTLVPYTTLFRSPGFMGDAGLRMRPRTGGRHGLLVLIVLAGRRMMDSYRDRDHDGCGDQGGVDADEELDRKSTRLTPVTRSSRMPSSA